MAVAETGSLSRAAEKLFIAQPPLSVQVRQLEEELGVALFVRHARGVSLTPAGEALRVEARFLLDRAARLRETMSEAGRRSRLSLGFVPSASSTVLPELVKQLHKVHPQLDLELHEMISAEQVEALAGGRIDFGLVRAQVRHQRVVMACRMDDPFCIAVPAGDAAGKGSPTVDLREFAERDFIGFTRHRGPAYFDQAIQVCTQAGFSPRIRYEASTVHGVIDLVAAGLGVALVPESIAVLERRGVKLRPLRRKSKPEVLGLIHRRDDAHALRLDVAAAIQEIFSALRKRTVRLIGMRS
jgi:DNA-binding transcriptional LysR family regulator